MDEINFRSTFRIPVSQQGINKAKRTRLRKLTNAYGGLVGTSNSGYARVSIDNKLDNEFICKLKTIGYKIFQKFDGEKVPNEKLDEYIQELLDSRNYNQFGKQKRRMINKSI